MPGKGAHPVARFMALVSPETIAPGSCWHWRGAGRGGTGYGGFNLDGNVTTAHRAAYLLFTGDIPPNMDVCHSCDNRWCVNPEHLFLGTRADNMADCMRKGRATNRRKHLNERQVQEIRRLLGCGHRVTKVAAITGVSHAIISNISKGKSYGRVA